jgi:uncharacterized protein (DUF433 family)
MRWDEHITSDPQILRGKPCIKGTRIPVALILGCLAADRTRDDILREFPEVATSDIPACLDYARDLAEFSAVAA